MFCRLLPDAALDARRNREESRRRFEALEAARLAGRQGAARIPDELLFTDGRDPTDTFIGQLADAFSVGQSERSPPPPEALPSSSPRGSRQTPVEAAGSRIISIPAGAGPDEWRQAIERLGGAK